MGRSFICLGIGFLLLLCVIASVEADEGLISLKGSEIGLKGELEYELVDTEDAGSGTSESDPHLQLDKLVLQPVVKIGDGIKMDAQIYVQESKAFLNEIHTKFSNLGGGDSWLDVGLYERWAKSHYKRITEGYPLIGTAFWRDDALTITWGRKYQSLYWMLSVGNGYEIDDKQVAEDGGSVQQTIHDDHSTSDFDSLEWGVNLGYCGELGNGKVDLLVFYYLDSLSDSDIATLTGFLPATYTSTDDDKNRLGFGVKYVWADWKVVGQYITAEDGDLDRDGYAVELSRQFEFSDGEWFTGVTPVLSYGELNVDTYDQDPSKPQSWDREKAIVGLIFDLYKNAKIKAEYYLNDEDTGGSDVDNDEILVQMEVKF